MLLSALRAISINWIYIVGTRFEYFTNYRVLHRLLDCNLSEFQKEGSGYYLKQIDDILKIKDYYLNQVLTNILVCPL